MPSFPENAVVLMDNASAHKREDIIKAIATDGIKVEFLPPYSPDRILIEKNGRQQNENVEQPMLV